MTPRLLLLLAATLAAPSCGVLDSHPSFSAVTLDGEKWTQETARGRAVLVQFWTTWCGYCRRDQETLDALAREFTSRDLLILAVNIGESREKVKGYLAGSPRSVRVVLDGDTDLDDTFSPRGFPYYALLDAEGKRVGTQRGSGGEAALRNLLGKAELGVRR